MAAMPRPLVLRSDDHADAIVRNRRYYGLRQRLIMLMI